MKCRNCGAHFRARELDCPYCGTPNPKGAMWQRERQAAEAEYDRVSGVVAPALRRQAANRFLNRLLLIEAGIFALFFVILAAVFFMGGVAGKMHYFFHREEVEAELAALYREERFGALYARLSELDLVGEAFYEYSQISLLYYDYEDFTGARMEFIALRDGGEEVEEDDVEWLLNRMHDLLSPHIPAYPEFTERNNEYLKRWQADVEQFATAVLGMGEEETAVLRQDYITMEETDALVQAVLQRGAWK